ncbi:dienelactone hydrolase family protein [Salegentibacter chungangensis]|uniref:Dienelactone hydrolase family protein n=1 Tax=Salegentibacter chungangensis TaxID=1335724 RepID=A0ABW3NP94_9FLAO
MEKEIIIALKKVNLYGFLAVPENAKGIVLFSHGSGSSRYSVRNNQVADFLRKNGLATLLFDLLTIEEDKIYENRFDISLLTKRLIAVTRWLKNRDDTKDLLPGYFGSSTGAASALRAAAKMGEEIRAVVSRGGRPDLAEEDLSAVTAPTLLIVGGEDLAVITLNEIALKELTCEKELKIIPGATHLFEEPGKLEEVSQLALDWFQRNLR